MSDKTDRKEREMRNENVRRVRSGRYLNGREPHPGGLCRWIRVTLLLVWDGVLLFMIIDCLIAPVYGAVFIGVISMYLGYQL